MAHVNLRIFSAKRLRVLSVALALVAVPASSPAALAEPPPVPAPTVAEPEPELAVRVVRMPSSLSSRGLQQLAAELRIAGGSTAVLALATGSPDLAESITDESLRELADATLSSRLFVLGDAPAVLQSFRQVGVRFEPVGSATALRARLGVDPAHRVDAVDGGTLSGESLSGLIAPPEDDSGGLSPLIPVIVALGVGVLALTGRHLRAAIGQNPQPHAPHERAPSTAARPRQTRRRRSPVADDAPLPASGRGLVCSELQPEGYVELGGCLRRARWAEAGVEPPAPGGWVDVAREHGRLIAFASGPTRGVVRS
jgi:hypothetical protein